MKYLLYALLSVLRRLVHSERTRLDRRGNCGLDLRSDKLPDLVRHTPQRVPEAA